MKKIILFCAFLVLLCFLYCEHRDPKEALQHIEKETPTKVIAPLPHADIGLASYHIKTKKDTVIKHNSGATIRIPKNAFIDANGNVITDDVLLNFRSFSNPLDIFLSGIPMAYKTDGVEKVFESAGMIEIRATSLGKQVFVNPKNKIKVDLLSFQAGSEFNVYNLDTLTGKWQDQGKDVITIDNYKEELEALPKVPLAPKEAGVYAFTIEDATGRYPELLMYENILFEPINNEPCGFTATGIDVSNLGNGTYNIRFTFDFYGIKKERSCICYLAFKEGVDYDNALKAYQKKYASLITLQKEKRSLIEKKWGDYKTQLKAYRSFLLREKIDELKPSEKITRTLEVNNFGFINIDYPLDYPQGGSFAPKYVDKNSKPLKLNNVVLVEKGRNALFKYTKEIKYNPKNENLLWGINNEGKLAYFKNEQFERLDSKKEIQTLEMNVYTEKELTYDKILAILFED